LDAGSLRIAGDIAFLFYRDSTGSPYSARLKREDGVWKVDYVPFDPVD
jgi:hypothetical protein